MKTNVERCDKLEKNMIKLFGTYLRNNLIVFVLPPFDENASNNT